MALVIKVSHTQNQAVNSITISDITGTYDALNNPEGYGAPNDARNARGNYLLVSQNDKAGTRTYLNVSNTTPLTTLSWNITTTEDGWEQATLLSPKIWDNGQAYVVDDVIFYSVTAKFYTCIQVNTNIAPDSGSGSQYWTEVTDFTVLQQGHTNLDVIDYHFLVRSRVDIYAADKLEDAIDDNFKCNLEDHESVDIMNFLTSIEAAESAMTQQNYSDAEEIINALVACIED